MKKFLVSAIAIMLPVAVLAQQSAAPAPTAKPAETTKTAPASGEKHARKYHKKHTAKTPAGAPEAKPTPTK